MQPRHRVSRAAIELIKRFEGYRRAAAQLPDGRWTIGHGHTLSARQGAEVSPDDAEALLLYDLIAIAHALNEAVFTPLTQNQFDALASFVFNIGLDNFHRSGVLRRLNEGATIQAAYAMELWRKAEVGGERIVIDSLVRRRASEKALFLTPQGGVWVPAPSPILKPLLDADAEGLVPRHAPVEVTASMEGERVVVLRQGEPTPAPAAYEDEDQGPARAAAESVSARLSSLFQDPGEERDPEPTFGRSHASGDLGPAAFARLDDPVPFFLRAPEPQDVPDEAAFEDELAENPVDEDDTRGRDLFEPQPADGLGVDEGAHGEDPGNEERADDGGDSEGGHQVGRTIIDDSAPYDFIPAKVQPLPSPGQGGLLTLVALAALGLTFFGGGIFWATNARTVAHSAWLGPKLVGGLAGVAGVGFFVVAIYFLLERLGRVSERRARSRR
ncbi:lysozyme [Phenylobacterium sp.]|uniref:lysozyme n=1 Tax=Phenylobacterium sp. TaxID=1871053 RepID=UPI002F4155D4